MAEVRCRKPVNETGSDGKAAEMSGNYHKRNSSAAVSSDCMYAEEDKLPETKSIDQPLPKSLPQSGDSTADILASAMKNVPDSWKNWLIRAILSWIMICGFGVIICDGPLDFCITTREMLSRD